MLTFSWQKNFPYVGQMSTQEYLHDTLHNVKTSFVRVLVVEFTRDRDTSLSMFLGIFNYFRP